MPRRSAVVLATMLVVASASLVTDGRAAARFGAGAASGEALWIADTAGIHQIALTDGRLTLSVPEDGGAGAVAVDADRSTVWAFGASYLKLFDRQLSTFRSDSTSFAAGTPDPRARPLGCLSSQGRARCPIIT